MGSRVLTDIEEVLVSSDESTSKECDVVLLAPSLSEVLSGTLTSARDISTVEQGIWNPDTPETFLQSSLQFLEHKLHDRIFQTPPSPSGQVVLTEGFVFAPVFPTTSSPFLDPVDDTDEHVVQVHNFDDEDSKMYLPKRNDATNSVNPLMYSCVSFPSISDVPSSCAHSPCVLRTGNEGTSQRDVGIQTCSFPLSENPRVPIVDRDVNENRFKNFSDYIDCCNMSTTEKTFDFGGKQTKRIFVENLPPDQTTTNTTFLAHGDFFPPTTNYSGKSNSSRQTAFYNPRCKSGGRSTSPSEVGTRSTSTGRTVKSLDSKKPDQRISDNNQSDTQHSATSTKSVYYYARISASFFSFLNRAIQKNRQENHNRSYSNKSKMKRTEKSDSACSISTPGQAKIGNENSNERKYSKQNVLQRFVSFFGGSKASRNYEKVKDPSGKIATVIDVEGRMFVDMEGHNDLSSTTPTTKKPQRMIKQNSFPPPHTTNQFPGSNRLSNTASSEGSIDKKKLRPHPKPSTRTQFKSKSPNQFKNGRHADVPRQKNFSIQTPSMQPKFLDNITNDHIGSSDFRSKLMSGDKTVIDSKSTRYDLANVRLKSDAKVMLPASPSSFNEQCCMCFDGHGLSNTTNETDFNEASLHQYQPAPLQKSSAVHRSENVYMCYQGNPFNKIRIVMDNKQCPTLQTGLDQNKGRPQTKTDHVGNIYTQSPKLQYAAPVQNNGFSQKCHVSTQAASCIPVNNNFTWQKDNVATQTPTKPNSQQPNFYKNSFAEKSHPYTQLFSTTPNTTTATWPKQNAATQTRQKIPLIPKPQVIHNNLTRQSTNEGDKTFDVSPRSSRQGSSLRKDFSSQNSESSKTGRLEKVNKWLPQHRTCFYVDECSSSEEERTTAGLSKTVSASSHSTFWIPNKRLAHNYRGVPHRSPIRREQHGPLESNDVVKLYQRPPNLTDE